MAIGETRLRFGDGHEAELWFDQLRTQWVVTSTKIEPDPNGGGVFATAFCATEGGALIPIQRDEGKQSNGKGKTAR